MAATFTSVADNVAVPNAITEGNSICQMIHWCDFTTVNQRTNLFNDPLSSYEDLRTVDGEICETFQAACIKLGLWDGDEEIDISEEKNISERII